VQLNEFAPGRIWLCDYPVRYAGARFLARTTIIRLKDRSLLIHSPCEMREELAAEIATLGEVAHIVAPGTFHYFHVASCQRAFPAAQTYICPGIERKRPEIAFDWLLGDRSPAPWAEEIDQVLIRGTRFISEVAFFDRVSRTLVLVDLVENIGDATPGTDRVLRFWWKVVMRMWNRARPAPEYQLGWGHKRAVAASLGRILEWDFERVVIAHGDPIEKDARAVVREAWARPLRWLQPT
jgi:hypothetical protein